MKLGRQKIGKSGRWERFGIRGLGRSWAAPVLIPALLLVSSIEETQRAQEPATAAPGYRRGPSTDPSGSGKFYRGREISHVMGHLGAGWLERPGRRREERTDLLLEALNLESGDVVADIGAGTGYFSFPMAERVGPEGRILAVDIQPEMLELIGARIRSSGVENVVPVLGAVDDPGLPLGEVDLALLVDVYHELSHPWEMTAAIAAGLKEGGRLVIVEYRGEDPRIPIKKLHKMTEAQVRREVEIHPRLQWVETLDVLPTQHIVIFEKSEAGEAPTAPG